MSGEMRRLAHQKGSTPQVTLFDYITCMVKVTSQTTYGHESVLRLLRKWAESKLGGHSLSFTSMTLNSSNGLDGSTGYV